MKNTSPKTLRAELKDYLDLAAKEPLRIQRRSGENLILMHEDVYVSMQEEIASLQRRLLSAFQIAEKKTTRIGTKEERLRRLKNNE